MNCCGHSQACYRWSKRCVIPAFLVFFCLCLFNFVLVLWSFSACLSFILPPIVSVASSSLLFLLYCNKANCLTWFSSNVIIVKQNSKFKSFSFYSNNTCAIFAFSPTVYKWNSLILNKRKIKKKLFFFFFFLNLFSKENCIALYLLKKNIHVDSLVFKRV